MVPLGGNRRSNYKGYEVGDWVKIRNNELIFPVFHLPELCN